MYILGQIKMLNDDFTCEVLLRQEKVFHVNKLFM